MNKLTQVQSLSQKISPQQILTSKLLEVSSESLTDLIENEIQENPALELDNTKDSDNLSDEDFSNFFSNYRKKRNQSEQLIYENTLETSSEKKNLYELLIEQLDFLEVSDKERFLAEYVIVNLEKNGYLKSSAENLVSTLLYDEDFEATTKEVEEAIMLVKTMEPVGVGAKNLKEYLKTQIHNLKIDESLKNNCLKIIEILPDYLEYKKNLESELIKHCDTSFGDAKALIKTLKIAPYEEEPSIRKNNEIHIDFIVEVKHDRVIAKLVDSYVPLRVNNFYRESLKVHKEKKTKVKNSDASFFQKKINKAELFINALTQREATFEKVINTIVECQHDFFINEDKYFLKPLTLSSIAEKSGLDISTVSRVVNKKYVKTDFGVFSLKEFFSSSLSSKEGNVSSTQIKIKIKELINNENKKFPLSDLEISNKLKKEGFNVARRTVAKYRELMEIAVSSARKVIL